MCSGRASAATLTLRTAHSGLRGHPAIDETCGYGTPIHALYDGVAYKVLTPGRPSNDGSGFTGVFQLVDNGIECFEWLTGHCDPTVSEGDKKTDVFATEANHGQVYSGNIQITLAMQKAGNHEGSHRHYQKRPVMPVAKTSLAYEYLTTYGGSPYRTPSGQYLQIFDAGMATTAASIQIDHRSTAISPLA